MAPTTLVMVAARPGVSCRVMTGVVAVPAPTLVKLTEPVTLDPTGAEAGKFAKLADISVLTEATLKVAVVFAELVSLLALPVPVPVTPVLVWVNPTLALIAPPMANVGVTPVKVTTPVAWLYATLVAPTTLVMVAATPGVNCSVMVAAVAVPGPTLVKLTEPVTLEPTGAEAGKFAKLAEMSALTEATLNVAVLLAGLVSLLALPVPVPATPVALWVKPMLALMAPPTASVG
ncbi:MAG: hypothetical protein Q7T55_00915, partial [Solirubrobacteraceae bacterium]|nr:hypothetical protein [Solirubrobacteraceae bacterium]